MAGRRRRPSPNNATLVRRQSRLPFTVQTPTMPCEQNDKDVLREWRESAPYWAKHAGTVRSMFAPITRALIEAAAIHEGHSVLDVAGGSGEPSITIAEALGPSGSIICTDAVAEMVRASRSE